MEVILYRALVGALVAGVFAGISMLFKFIINKSTGSTDDECKDEADDNKKETQPSKIPLIIGIVLLVLQLLSYIGNITAGSLSFFQNIHSLAHFMYELLYFIGYNLIGIIGCTLLIIGIKTIYKKSSNQSPTDQLKKRKVDFVSFIQSRKKIIIVLTIVCSSLFLISLVIYNICDSNMQDAYRHYVATQGNYTSTHSVGCANDSCYYCEGAFYVNSIGKSFDLYSFRYYKLQSGARTAFAVIGIIFLILTVVSLILLTVCLIKHKNKLKADKNEQLQLYYPPHTYNLERKFCKYCGKQIDTDSTFCPYCGENITKSKNQN